MKKEIILGNYKYDELGKNRRQVTSCYGGTNNWNKLIKEAGLIGTKLQLILKEK